VICSALSIPRCSSGRSSGNSKVQFDSLKYLLFFPAVWVVYLLVPAASRWAVLLAASVFFYAMLKAPLLIFAWATVVAISFFAGLRIAASSEEATRKRILWAGIIANVCVLAGIKYLRLLFHALLPTANSVGNRWFVTLGVSYYTLQAISYLVDLYLGTAEPERHCGRFALYMGFFPKLLQGPIERASDLLPQLHVLQGFDYGNVRSGLLLFAWGLFKKVAVANRLAAYVNTVYYDPHGYSGITLAAATYMYAIQVYADFSGYTDMALGVARLFNIRLTQNFNSPYLAASVADFWRRWHISFSRWILDYIFKPLQMQWRDAQTLGVAAALMVTFLFSGLWHGASMNFVIWGALHGVFIATSVFTKPWQDRVYEHARLKDHPLRRLIQVFVTFHLVTFAWIFFRASSLADAWYVVTHLLSTTSSHVSPLASQSSGLANLLSPVLMDKGMHGFALMTLSVLLMFAGSYYGKRIRVQAQPLLVRWGVYYALVLALVYLSVYDDVGFVYFQF
jgi:alginate O-acetyltransferase complex protein AlgI